MKSIFKIVGAILCAVWLQYPLPAATAINGAAFVPANPPDMKPIASHDTPAWRVAQRFQRGVNLGDYLEAPPRNFGRGVTVAAAGSRSSSSK